MPKRILIAGLLSGALGVAAMTAPILAYADSETLPDFSGVWTRTGEPHFEPIAGDKDGKPVERLEVQSRDAEEIMAGNFDNPILQPWAREVVKKNAESEIALKHVYQADDSCWPIGVPAVINLREAVQFLQAKDRVVILYQRDHHVRHIWLNRDHPAKLEPSWWGESIGHYEGDTLVVDTIGLKTHQMSFVDPFGTPHTEKLHVVERYRPIQDDKGKGIEVIVRVEDPGAFTTPWKGRSLYRPNRAPSLEEVVCAENNRSFDGSSFGTMPEEKTAQF
jgi:hypothetical protein